VLPVPEPTPESPSRRPEPEAGGAKFTVDVGGMLSDSIKKKKAKDAAKAKKAKKRLGHIPGVGDVTEAD
jgi:hypothetical protein